MKLSKLLKQWMLEGLVVTDKLETEYFELNELNIDSLNSYEYEEVKLPIYTKAYKFDDKRINTVYKILLEEIVPEYLLKKKPSKIYFNPISASRDKLVSILIGKIIKVYPQLIRSNNYLINK